MSLKKIGFAVILVFIVFMCSVSVAVADDNDDPIIIVVTTESELIDAAKNDSGTIQLGANLSHFIGEITLKSKVTFDANGHTINIISGEASSSSITCTTPEQLNELIGCVIGDGCIIDFTSNKYYSVYLGVS